MTEKELSSMTVLQLRKLAKDRRITLGAGIDKAGIVRKILENESAFPVRLDAPVDENIGAVQSEPVAPPVRDSAAAQSRVPVRESSVPDRAAGQAAAEAQLALSQLNGGGGAGIDPNSIKATDPKAIEEAVENYAKELKELTEVLERVKIQAARMSTDSEEMENLNRTLTGIATVYELQLRNISKQVSTIEQIDEQTRRMAKQIEELNNVYGRMIQALTVNMGGAPAPAAAPEQEA